MFNLYNILSIEIGIKAMNLKIWVIGLVEVILIFQCGGFNFDGTTTLTLAYTSSSGSISENGKRCIFSATGLDMIDLYKNNGQNFQYSETINTGFNIQKSYSSVSGEYILASSGSSGEIWRCKNGQNCTLLQILSYGFFSAIFSKNEQKLFLSFINGSVIIYQKNSNIFQFDQTINTVADSITRISVAPDESFFGLATTSFEIIIYQKLEGEYIFIQTLLLSSHVSTIKVNKNALIFSSGATIYFFENNGTEFVESGNLTLTGAMPIISIFEASEDFSMIYGAAMQGFFVLSKQNSEYVLKSSTNELVFPAWASIGPKALYFISAWINSTVAINYICPKQCAACSFPNNCSFCIEQHHLQNGVCKSTPKSMCVDNIYASPGICKNYCSKQCKTCSQNKEKCTECEDGYVKSEEGQCVLQDQVLSVVTKLRFFINLVRRGSFKFIFFVMDDIWLYNYHEIDYDGIMGDTLKVIQVIEEKQWEMVGLSKIKKALQKSVIIDEEYNSHSNKKYMEKQRKNNVLLSSTIDFFVFFIPFSVISTFLLNRLFYILFDYSISICFRPYSFWAILIELLIQNNIEYFTFLGFRALAIPFSFQFASKWLFIFSVTFFFITTLLAFSSYAFYYGWYGKLARYFLVNMYRFPSSYALMIILYGVRPFLKGVIHSLFFNNVSLQLSLLAGTQIGVIIITLAFQYLFDNHKRYSILFLEILYMTCLVTLNFLLLNKHCYGKEASVQKEFEEKIKIVFYIMIFSLGIRLILEFLPENPLTFIREICCKKKQAKVSPTSDCSLNKKKQRKNENILKLEQEKNVSKKKANYAILNYFRNQHPEVQKCKLKKKKKSRKVKKEKSAKTEKRGTRNRIQVIDKVKQGESGSEPSDKIIISSSSSTVNYLPQALNREQDIDKQIKKILKNDYEKYTNKIVNKIFFSEQ